jgi:hypothetical protein
MAWRRIGWIFELGAFASLRETVLTGLVHVAKFRRFEIESSGR